MRISEVAKSYAKALLAVAKQQGTHSKVFGELKAISEAFKMDTAVKSYFANPMISSDQKVAAVKAALTGKGVSQEVLNTLVLMGEKGRLEALDQVVHAFQEMLDLEEGITRGVIRSAQPLSAEAQKEIEQKINKVLNKKIVLTYQQDPKLLGGVVAQVGGWTFDDSIDTHLKKLNEELNRRAN
ncbi:ATP synthase subunit delta [Bdellovibrio bacteriovorus]|uniref:ATP synthase subunit delta n=1 Tax=Bdellovibrio bacteriovorus TaxID=959 RepID=A0A150WWF7_BDEBC|nr:ATP synthase F1 subunit delta [Bdellovibrio bacteriovorus]KYG70857.1 ATP synthase subunit delta [Bdellovibrio bacteriovorus]